MSGRDYLKGTTCVSAYHVAHADCEVTPCLLQLLLIQAPTCTVSYTSPLSQFTVLFKFDVTVNGKKKQNYSSNITKMDTENQTILTF